MYPNTFFSLFPPFPRNNKVFVAMSFDKRFDARWENVIKPAIARVAINTDRLEAQRVDARVVSDSILTEILSGIANAKLVFADITMLNKLDDTPIRNANVLYEVGIAHAVRLPEEVILFRSDSEKLLFDTSNVRVNSYDPDGNPDAAQTKVSEALFDSLKELELKRHLAVQRGLESLDFQTWSILGRTIDAALPHPIIRTYGETLASIPMHSAIHRLLDLGMIRPRFLELTPDVIKQINSIPTESLVSYVATEFGKAVYGMWSQWVGLTPEKQAEINAVMSAAPATT